MVAPGGVIRKSGHLANVGNMVEIHPCAVLLEVQHFLLLYPAPFW
jgi:hypothetical protein